MVYAFISLVRIEDYTRRYYKQKEYFAGYYRILPYTRDVCLWRPTLFIYTYRALFDLTPSFFNLIY